MRYYLDFEFCDKTLTPISLGLVSQTGAELYLVNVDWKKVIESSPNREWLAKNVAPFLDQYQTTRSQRTYHVDHWSDAIDEFIMESVDGHPEFWGYFADYDWVLFCKLYGTMVELPKHFPNFCLDLKQLALSVGIKVSLKQLVKIEDEHNALADARWMKRVHEQIIFQYGRDK